MTMLPKCHAKFILSWPMNMLNACMHKHLNLLNYHILHSNFPSPSTIKKKSLVFTIF